MKALVLIFCLLSAVASARDLDVGFSPGGSAEELIIRAIRSARQEILVAAYSFTHKEIAANLLEAHRRGVVVKVVVDSSQIDERYTSATFLANSGIPVRIDRDHSIMHNKYLVIDRATVSTGSFNFTTSAAKRNAENVVVVWNSESLAHQYASDWLRHWSHSSAYPARY